MLSAFNRQGGFDNLDDTEDGLRDILGASFEHVELEGGGLGRGLRGDKSSEAAIQLRPAASAAPGRCHQPPRACANDTRREFRSVHDFRGCSDADDCSQCPNSPSSTLACLPAASL